MQTVLITGANGFVAGYITELLVANYYVIATSKGMYRPSFMHPNLQYQVLDFTNEEDVKLVLEKYKPDLIVHTGALSKPDDCENDKALALLINTTGTKHLLKYATLYKSFFIFLSTDFIFNGIKGFYVENDQPEPVNYYGETKLLAEFEVRKYNFEWTIVRTVLVYGNRNGGRHNLLTLVAEKLKSGEAFKVFNDQVRTPTYVEDLAGAIVMIIIKRATGIYHISGKDVRTPYEMAVATARHLGLDESLLEAVTADSFQQPAKRPAITGFNIEKAEKELNFKPVSFDEGLKKTFDEEAFFFIEAV